MNLLTGMHVDEVFAGTAAGGSRYPLTDALGSILALTDENGTIQTSYAYSPYGSAQTSGAPSGNEFGFTGREWDGPGLYYFRARYYSPYYRRWLAEDPIGLAGGSNIYTYVLNNPLSDNDSYGLWEWPSLPQWFVNASAALGDNLLFGQGQRLRNLLGISGGANQCSTSYRAGTAVGILGTFATGEGEANIVFKTGHYAADLIAQGINVAEAEAAVAAHLSEYASTIEGWTQAQVVVKGTVLNYYI